MRRIFQDCPDIVVECEAVDGAEAFALLKTTEIDAVVLDLSMPRRSGLAVLRRLRARYPALPVLIVSMHAEEKYAVNVLKAGANGYLSKDNAADELIHAVRVVLSGKTYIGERLAAALADQPPSGENTRAPHERLSPQEFEVFYQMAAGKSSSFIASDLFLSVKTVQTHRARILEKLGLQSNTALVHYAISNALIEY